MSELDNAINSINASATKASKTASFLDQLGTYDDNSNVTNPNNGAVVPSIQKKVKDTTNELFSEAETSINEAVNTATGAVNFAGAFVSGSTSAIAGKSYSFDGGYWTCVANTTSTPSLNNSAWRKVIGQDDIDAAEERAIGVGASIYRGSNGVYVQDGDAVPVGTTHLTVLINGKVEYLVAWDTLTLPAVIITVPTTDNGFAGYDVVTDQGTFEFVSNEISALRGRNNYPTVSCHIDLLGWGITGSGDETAKVQKAVDFTILKKGILYSSISLSLTMGNVTLANAAGTSFEFNNKVTFNLSGDGASNGGLGFQVIGDATGLKFSGANIVGDNVEAHMHKGLWSNSGPIWVDCDIYDNDVSYVINGISVNANISGSIRNTKIYRNKLKNIIGTSSGYGYGIHWAYPDADVTQVTCFDNEIDNASRHSIYCASGGHSDIYGNTITNHRKDVFDGSLRPAINLLRGSHIKCHDNWVFDSYDGYINASGSKSDSLEGSDIEIYENHLINRLNGVQYITIGEGAYPQALTRNIDVHHNHIYTDFSVGSGGNTVVIYGGTDIDFHHNRFVYENVTSGTLVGIKYGSTGITTDSDFTNSKVRHNTFVIRGTYTLFKAVSLVSEICVNTSAHEIYDNTIDGDGANQYIERLSTQTNPNLKYDDWTAPTYNDTWAQVSAAERILVKWNKNGLVQIRGRVSANGATSTTAFILPAHCINNLRSLYMAARDNAGYAPFTIDTSGNVIVDSIPSSWVSFEGMQYSIR